MSLTLRFLLLVLLYFHGRLSEMTTGQGVRVIQTGPNRLSLVRLVVSSWPVIGLVLAFIPTSVKAQPVNDKATIIHVVVVETHDRVTPTPNPGIVFRHEADILMKSGKQIEEHIEHINLGDSKRPVGDNKLSKAPSNDNSTSLGENGTKIVWHVLGPNNLQRLSQSPSGDLLIVWTIRILANNQCSLDVKYLLEQGKTTVSGKIMGTGPDATFGNYKVLQAECTIQ